MVGMIVVRDRPPPNIVEFFEWIACVVLADEVIRCFQTAVFSSIVCHKSYFGFRSWAEHLPYLHTHQTGEVFASPRGSVAGVQSITIGQIRGASKMSSSRSLTTNLGIGVQDYWSGSTRGSQGGLRTSESTSSVIVPTTLGAPLAGPPGRDGIPPELWLQDEREVKRQRRKQSNRESARRSRLRKQAECEELGTKVDTLTVENMALRTELTRLSEECEKLTAENTFLLGQLQKAQEDDADAEVLLNKGVESKGELAPLPCYGHGRILRMSCESPQIHGTRAHDEDSSDSTGKGSSPLELGTCPEAVTAV